jgi:endonuclease/exonuclease/phosphatase family metal-dependent hydrolase
VTEPLRLRVLTYNIHGGRPETGPVNLAAIADVIRETRADLVALQEVHRFLPPWNTLRDQPKQLGNLVGMHASFLPSFRIGKAGYGNVILSREKPRSVRRIRLPRGGEPRAVLVAEMELERVAFRFLNTHLEYRDLPRARHAAALADLVPTLDPPLIVAGDLNADPESRDLEAVRAAGLEPCAPPHLLTYTSENPACQIDHILVTADIRVLSAATLPTTASDHLPLLADLEIPREK